ncbi:hypothetical protein AWC38_SpisGene7518 [Stylophora pistillata]|uniref:Uncharacterized protein n=1 Tax=Stylophora pistillata TaxID=50429 RepID=A0A2B4SGZ7_STYPI|nr:hypothetical protein AWC38_SpisGene7518 [Stylophora pistillata]
MAESDDSELSYTVQDAEQDRLRSEFNDDSSKNSDSFESENSEIVVGDGDESELSDTVQNTEQDRFRSEFNDDSSKNSDSFESENSDIEVGDGDKSEMSDSVQNTEQERFRSEFINDFSKNSDSFESDTGVARTVGVSSESSTLDSSSDRISCSSPVHYQECTDDLFYPPSKRLCIDATDKQTPETKRAVDMDTSNFNSTISEFESEIARANEVGDSSSTIYVIHLEQELKKRIFHGSRGIPDQICKRLARAHSKQYIQQCVAGNDEACEFTQGMLTSNSPKAVGVNDEDVKLFTPMLHKIPHVGNPIEGYFNDDREDCHNDGYAVVRLIDNIGLNVCSSGIDPPRDPVAETFWSSGFLGHHFVAVRFTRRFKLIRCMQIETRVVFVESDEPNIDGYV